MRVCFSCLPQASLHLYSDANFTQVGKYCHRSSNRFDLIASANLFKPTVIKLFTCSGHLSCLINPHGQTPFSATSWQTTGQNQVLPTLFLYIYIDTYIYIIYGSPRHGCGVWCDLCLFLLLGFCVKIWGCHMYMHTYRCDKKNNDISICNLKEFECIREYKNSSALFYSWIQDSRFKNLSIFWES